MYPSVAEKKEGAVAVSPWPGFGSREGLLLAGAMDGWMDGRMDGWMDGWMDGRMSQAEMKIVGHVEKNASLLFTFFSIISPIFLSTKNQCGQAE